MDTDIIEELNKLSDSELTKLQTILNITSDMRIHMSKTPIYKLEKRNYQQSIGMKPQGLWYGFGKEWIDWVESEMPQWKGEYIYNMNVNDSNILQIKDYSEIINFTNKYIMIPSTYHINWNKVSFNYDGIEINPYIWKARHEFLWYYGWDVASGCIWNLDKVSIERI